ncbi:MAG TPA: hypothetical protein VEC13_02095 [Candidatus Paceibacterota bacterium]|nr:hypothetical protein [Candidatus Paceibacterota bacterium]
MDTLVLGSWSALQNAGQTPFAHSNSSTRPSLNAKEEAMAEAMVCGGPLYQELKNMVVLDIESGVLSIDYTPDNEYLVIYTMTNRTHPEDDVGRGRRVSWTGKIKAELSLDSGAFEGPKVVQATLEVACTEEGKICNDAVFPYWVEN